MVDVTITYHTFVGKLGINMQFLPDNVCLSRWANIGGSYMWIDVVAICRD